jgi:hypothetical protein
LYRDFTLRHCEGWRANFARRRRVCTEVSLPNQACFRRRDRTCMIANAASAMGSAATRTAPRAVAPERPHKKQQPTISPGTATNLPSRYSTACTVHHTLTQQVQYGVHAAPQSCPAGTVLPACCTTILPCRYSTACILHHNLAQQVQSCLHAAPQSCPAGTSTACILHHNLALQVQYCLHSAPQSCPAGTVLPACCTTIYPCRCSIVCTLYHNLTQQGQYCLHIAL